MTEQQPIIRYLVLLAGLTGVAVLTGLLLTGCRSGSRIPLQEPVSVLGEQLDRVARQANIPGASYAVVGPAGMIWHHQYGVVSLTDECAPTTRTLFALASVSKVFTGVATLQLVEEGRIGLDDPVSFLLGHRLENPGINTVPITIRHLLTHTSGLAEGTYGQTTQKVPAGIHFDYTNQGFAYLAQMIEILEGRSYPDLLRERVFQPAGMQDSFILPLGGDTPPECLASASYDRSGRRVVSPVERLPLGAGRAYSTAADLSIFLQAFLNGGGTILSADSVRQMTQPQLEGLDEPRLLAWEPIGNVDGRVACFHHAGSSDGIGTEVLVYPSDHLAIIVLTNTMYHASFHREARQLIYTAFTQKEHPRPSPSRPLEPQDAGGHYVSGGQSIHVLSSDGQLLIQFQAGPFQRLSPVGNSEFTTMPIQVDSPLETALARASGSIIEFIRFEGRIQGLVWMDEYYERE